MANRFLNTIGKPVLAIAICQRCQTKMAHADMVQDPNNGLRMHSWCTDELDRYRLPQREPDRIALSFVHREATLTAGPTDPTTPTNPGGGGQTPTGGDFGTDFNGDFSGGSGTGTDPDEEPPPGGGNPGGGNGAGDFNNDYNSDFS